MAVSALIITKARTDRRVLVDRLASRLVVVGGLIIIASILAILFVITAEVYPLFKSPTATALAPLDTGAVPAGRTAAGVDEYREIAYTFTAAGLLQFTPLRVRGSYPPVPIAGLEGAPVTTVASAGAGRHVIGTADGRAIPVEVKFLVEFKDGRRMLTPAHEFGAPVLVDDARRP